MPIATARRRGAATPTGLFGEELRVEAAPRADIDYEPRTAKKVRLWRRIVLAVLVLGVFAILGDIAYLPQLMKPAVAAKPADALTTSPTKATAILAVQSWLAQTPSPLPGGQFVSWDKVEIKQQYQLTTDANGQTTEQDGLELHTMTVSSGAAVFTTQVLVGYSPVRGAQVIGQPTLIPQAPSDKGSWPDLTPWPGLVKANRTDTLVQAATAWAAAFTSGDPSQLRQAVQDPSTDRSYVPLTGAAESAVQVDDVAAPKSTDSGKPDAVPTRVVARVSFALAWASQHLDPGQTGARVSYDVLIDKADTGSPVVVAWGGVGTGGSLQPYQNGIDGMKLGADQSGPTPQAQPTASAAAPAPAPAAHAPSPSPAATTGKK